MSSHAAGAVPRGETHPDRAPPARNGGVEWRSPSSSRTSTERFSTRRAASGPPPRAAVARLRALGVPVVPLTSKTEIELRALLPVLAAGGVGVFENGAGLVTPRGVEVDPAAVPVALLRQILADVARRRGIRIVPLDEMTDERLAALTGLGGNALAQARARVWDLPFLAPDGEDDVLEEEMDGVPRRPARPRRSLLAPLRPARQGGRGAADPRALRPARARRSGSATRRTTCGSSRRWTSRSSCRGPGVRTHASSRRSRTRGSRRSRAGAGWAAAVSALLDDEAA